MSDSDDPYDAEETLERAELAKDTQTVPLPVPSRRVGDEIAYRYGLIKSIQDSFPDIRTATLIIKIVGEGYERYQQPQLDRDYAEWKKYQETPENWQDYLDYSDANSSVSAKKYADELNQKKAKMLIDYPDITKWAVGPEGPGPKVWACVKSESEVYKHCRFGSISHVTREVLDLKDVGRKLRQDILDKQVREMRAYAWKNLARLPEEYLKLLPDRQMPGWIFAPETQIE